MDSENLIKYLKEIVKRNPPCKKIICEIFLFGSWATKEHCQVSDVDIFLLHSARNAQEYEYILGFISYFNKEVSKKKIVCDIFLTHNKSASFVIDHLGLYLSTFLTDRISVFNNLPIELFLTKKSEFKKNRKNIIKANAYLVFLDTFNNYPSVLHEQRRKNLKNAYWLARHFSEITSSNELEKMIAKRMSLIEMEQPLDTIENDVQLLTKLLSSASECDLYSTDIKKLVDVQIARYYLVDTKRSRQLTLSQNKEFVLFIQKGISLILKNTALNKLTLSSKCQVNIQYLIDIYLNSNNGEGIKNIKKDYCILLNTLDEFFVNI